ncbi:MAG: biliverdin-producing heme oxygenase [Magnetovibrionaceae bacterium]
MQGPLPEIISKLRQSTESRHQRVEATPLAARVMSPDLTLSGYGRLLFETHRIVAPMEHWLHIHGFRLAGFDQNETWSRLSDLESDLAGIKLAPPPVDTSLSDGLPETAGGVFGVLYVLEGSALGGHVITKQVTSHLGEAASDCIQFHSGNGTPAAERFRNLCWLARSSGPSPGFACDAEASAKIVFDGFIQVFEQADPSAI